MYGYRKSPRLWGNHRDKTLLKMIIDYFEGFLVLRPLVSEPNLWRVLYQQEGQPDLLMGLMIVYVDDLLILSNDQVGDLLVKHIQSHWELSPPERIQAEPGTRFLGAELWNFEDGSWVAIHSEVTLWISCTEISGQMSPNGSQEISHDTRS